MCEVLGVGGDGCANAFGVSVSEVDAVVAAARFARAVVTDAQPKRLVWVRFGCLGGKPRRPPRHELGLDEVEQVQLAESLDRLKSQVRPSLQSFAAPQRGHELDCFGTTWRWCEEHLEAAQVSRWPAGGLVVFM